MPNQNSYVNDLFTILTNNDLTKNEQYNQILQTMDLMIAEPQEINNPESCFDATNEKGMTPLFIAINTKHDDIVQELLARGANPNLGDRSTSITPLQLAAQKNNLPLVKMLLTAGAKPNMVSTGWSPLAYAIDHNNLDMVTILLKANVCPNTLEPSGHLPLNLVKSLEVMNTLINAKPYPADVNTFNSEGDTPLIYAIKQNKPRMVSNLLKAHAQPNLKNSTNKTPLSVAIDYNDATIVEELLLNGAAPDTVELHNQLFFWAIEQGHEKVVKLLLNNGANPNVIEQNDKTPLHSAYEHKQSKIITLLLQHGAKPQNLTLDNELFLQATERNDLATIRLLLAGGTRPNSIQGTKMPLMIALEGNHNELLELLLNAKVNPNQPYPETGITPLLKATIQNNLKAVISLLAAGAYLDFTQQNTNTPLNWAVYHGNRPMVQALLNAGAQSYSPDDRGYTPLLRAIEKNCDIVKALLNAKYNPANPNEPHVITGETPLLAAIRGKNFYVVESLLQAHANPNQKNEKTGQTPLMLATIVGYMGIIELLLAQGAQPSNQLEHTTVYKWGIINGSLNVVNYMLAHNSDVDLIPQENRTPLQLALDSNYDNRLHIIEALLTKGATLNNEKIKADIISCAVITGHINIIKIVLARQIHPDLILKDNKTAIQLAVEHNQIAIMQLLLEAKANPNVIDPHTGASLLSVAAKERNLKAVNMLLSAHANPTITEEGNSALDWAAYYNQFSMLTLLLKAGANPNRQTNRGDTPLILAIQHGESSLVWALLNAYPHPADPNCPHSITGLSPLMYAINDNNLEKVQLLLTAKANPNQINERTGHTALNVCANINERRGHTVSSKFGKLNDVNIAELLLQNGIQPSVHDLNGELFIWAISKGHCSILKQLLAQGANPNLKISRYESPLVIAQLNNQAETAELLMLAGADLNHEQINRTTLLFLAVEKNLLTSVELLLNSKIHLDGFNADRKTLLTIAAEQGYVKLADVLLNAGANPNLASRYNNKTPFVLACQKGSTDIARLLLNKQIEVRDAQDVLKPEIENLLNHAIQTKNTSMVLLFLQHQLVDSLQSVYRFISQQTQSNPDVAKCLEIVLASKSLRLDMLQESKAINYVTSLKRLEDTYDTLVAHKIEKAMHTIPIAICRLIQNYNGSFFKPTTKPIKFLDSKLVDHHLKQLKLDIASEVDTEQKSENKNTCNAATKVLSSMKNWFR